MKTITDLKNEGVKENSMYEDFKKWFYSRGEFYAGLKMNFYVDGEPYFASQGAECSYRDFERRKNLVKDYFTCKYIGGGGTEYDGGIWHKKETPKFNIFKQVKESFYNPIVTELKIHKEKPGRHVLRDWEDGTYTIYPNRSGTPHIFEPIPPEKIEDVIKLMRSS